MRALMYMVCAFVALWSTGIGAAIEHGQMARSVPLGWTSPPQLAPPPQWRADVLVCSVCEARHQQSRGNDPV